MELEIEDSTPSVIKQSDIKKKAEENKLAKELPVKPGVRVSFKEMLEWLRLLTPEMTEGNRIAIYVYRLEPAIIRQLADPEADNNIDVVMGAYDQLDEEYMRERHGGGKYRFIIKDLDNPKPQKGGHFEATLYIPMNQYPPVLNLKEVDWDNRLNKGFRAWCKSQGMIDDKNMPVELKAKQDNSQQSNSDMVAMMKMVMDYTTTLSEKQQNDLKKKIGGEDGLTKSIGDILLEKMKQDDPTKQTATLVSLLTAMKTMQPDIKPDNTLGVIMPMFMQMMTQMQESSKQQMTLVIEMMKANASRPSEDKKSTITEMKELFALFSELKGDAVQGKKSTAEVVADTITELLPPALGLASTFMQQRNQPGSVLNTNTTHNNNTGSTPTVVNQPTTPTIQGQQPQMTDEIAAIGQFAPMIIANLGKEGWEFAAWITEGMPNGEMIVATVIKNGVDHLMEVSKKVPQLWEVIEKTYGEPHYRKWLTSFVNYKEEIARIEREDNRDGNEKVN
jgi:hypothetical protein